jgi:hypothetical protein
MRSLPASKKHKTTPKASPSTSSHVQTLERQLTEALSSASSLNALVDLLDVLCAAESPSDASVAGYALYRVFSQIFTADKWGAWTGSREGKEVRAWVWERFSTYQRYLGGLLKDEEGLLRVRALCLSSCYILFHSKDVRGRNLRWKYCSPSNGDCPHSPVRRASRNSTLRTFGRSSLRLFAVQSPHAARRNGMGG